jgi:hypothetical protein
MIILLLGLFEDYVLDILSVSHAYDSNVEIKELTIFFFRKYLFEYYNIVCRHLGCFYVSNLFTDVVPQHNISIKITVDNAWVHTTDGSAN